MDRITKADLQKMTYTDMLQLKMELNEQISKYDDREKTKVFTVFLAFDGMKYFIEKPNAIKYLQELITDGEVFNGNEVKADEKYLTSAEVEQYCMDFKK